MIIDRLKYANNGADVDVYIDNHYSCRLSLDTIAKFGIHVGKALLKKELEEIIISEYVLRLFRKSINYISIRPRSETEQILYLNKQKIDFEINLKEKIVEEVIYKLKEKLYIDDKKFCKWLIDNRLAYSLKSRMEIRAELMTKGVEGSIINEALEKYFRPENEKEVFEKIFNKKFGKLDLSKIDKKTLIKINSYFLRKGFNYQLLQEKFNI